MADKQAEKKGDRSRSGGDANKRTTLAPRPRTHRSRTDTKAEAAASSAAAGVATTSASAAAATASDSQTLHMPGESQTQPGLGAFLDNGKGVDAIHIDDQAASDEEDDGDLPEPVFEDETPEPDMAHVPPEFQWLSQMMTNNTKAIRTDMKKQYIVHHKSIKQVKREVKSMQAGLAATNSCVENLRGEQATFKTEINLKLTAQENENRKLKDEIANIYKYIDSRAAGAQDDAASNRSFASTSTAFPMRPAAPNPYQRPSLHGYFIIGNLHGLAAELVEAFITSQIEKANALPENSNTKIVIEDWQYARPNANYAFVKYRGQGAETPYDIGMRFKRFLKEAVIMPISSKDGEPIRQEGILPLWSNLHREKAERERREVLNTPKSFIHQELRERLHLPELYTVLNRELRLVGGSFVKGDEDIQWRGQRIGKFTYVDPSTKSEVKEIEWLSSEIVSSILNAEEGYRHDHALFLSRWEQFLAERLSKRN